MILFREIGEYMRHHAVYILHFIIPRFIFKRIRRIIPLCRYNFHSARRLSDQEQIPLYDTSEICKHCGKFVYRDRNGHWRQHFNAR